MSLCVRKEVCCGKTADWIRMPFGVVSGVDRGMGVLDGGGDRRREEVVFGSEFGESHCKQLGLCCVVVCQRRALPKLLWGGLSLISDSRSWHVIQRSAHVITGCCCIPTPKALLFSRHVRGHYATLRSVRLSVHLSVTCRSSTTVHFRAVLTLLGSPTLQIDPTSLRGHKATGSSQNGNEAVTGAASETFGRWPHHRQGPDLQHLHDTPQSKLPSAGAYRFAAFRAKPCFYRAMHYRAKRGLAIACLSVCSFVCDVGGSGPYRLKILETNCANN